jgi:hypothetical protein
VGIQFWLAIRGLNAAKRLEIVSLTVLAVVVFAAWYGLFLTRTRIVVTEGRIIVRDWLGRIRFQGDRGHANLRFVSVRDVGIAEEFAILSHDNGTDAYLMRRAAWGDRALMELSTALGGGRERQLRYHPVSKAALRRDFPALHIQNIPAIAMVVVVVLLLAVAINWR